MWIQRCLRSSRGSILVNGSTTEEFQFFKGLKQGDPLSPFLFILIMESLHVSFQRVVDGGLFTGIKSNSMVSLSYLLYADDAIFIGQWSELNIDALVQVLECFYRASGLKINMCKSKIMGVNVDDGKIQNAASKLGCLVLKTPFTYLDKYFWSLESEGDYSVASIRKLIDEKRFQEVGISTRWVKSVPSKVNITAWKIKTNALPTRFNLSRREMDIDTLMFSSWWNVDYTDVSSYEECRVWLVSIRIPNKLKSMMEGVFFGLWWSIWNFRNKLLFDNKTPKKALIFDNLVSLSFNWCKYRCKASFKWDD
nr:RNA-directed DNA polymerase, eukaryota [Tanacetum cinerariifolium]